MKYFLKAKRAIALSMLSAIVLCTHVMAKNIENTELTPKSFVVEGRIEAGNKTIKYKAISSETILRDETGKPTAAIWSTSYIKKDAKKENRPVTFIYNGGPGSSASVLHIGLLGPKIVSRSGSPTTDDGAAPYPIISNPESILDLTDLVFVDPVGTGFSRAIGDKSNVDFWSMANDTKSMGDFIHQWVTTNQRWNSPKHILGLSYGSTRAVDVAHYLNSYYEMDLNGLLLLGPALEFAALSPVANNFLAYFSYIPTMATVAHYHGKAGEGKSMEAFAEEARTFTIDEYIPALVRGDRLTLSEKEKIAERYAYFTGLSKAYILRSNLKILVPQYRKEFLRETGLTIGRSDGRYTQNDYNDNGSEPLMGDPSYNKESGLYGAAFNHYLSELNVMMDQPYKLWNSSVGRDWDWSPDKKAYSTPLSYRVAKRVGIIEVASKLGKVMRWNEDLDVFVATGWYDLITPFFDAERSFASNGIVLDRVDMHYYESGHRLWVDVKSRQAIAKDIRHFFLSQK